MRVIARIFATVALAIAPGIALSAQEHPGKTKLTRSRAEQLIPRLSRETIESLNKSAAKEAIDTIDTSNPAMKLIIYEDKTWDWWKDGSVVAQQAQFKEHWDNFSANPYKVEYSSLPDKVNIWLVDSTGAYHYPIASETRISSRFGYRHGRWHRGIDLRSPIGTDVYATFSGKVRISKYIRGYGNLVVIRHDNGIETFYGHLSKSLVQQDEWVEAGQVIARSGNTGRSSGPHLHYEVRYQGFAIDPEWMIDFEKHSLRHRVLVLRKKYMNPASRYAPESDDDEEEIAAADERDRLEAERLEAEMKAARYVTVKSGDTLSGIAHRNGTTVRAICNLNNITPKTTLRIGRKLRVK